MATRLASILEWRLLKSTLEHAIDCLEFDTLQAYYIFKFNSEKISKAFYSSKPLGELIEINGLKLISIEHLPQGLTVTDFENLDILFEPVEPDNKEGMVQNPITGKWSWL